MLGIFGFSAYMYILYAQIKSHVISTQNTDDKHRRFSLGSVTDKPITSSPSRLKSLFAGIGFVDEFSEDYLDSDGL